ncbi:hypothetical protein Spb1_38240 [Planctopirus ephydatiae]|uniref:Uncharacterized protein n=1 Tax=Planctopirus ephydatiae TaxID=2528019 RepID=A0A518GTG1_9PLAN|nr:hypothetical protein Spb1_38240 [Planctopirus ephydatiae]
MSNGANAKPMIVESRAAFVASLLSPFVRVSGGPDLDQGYQKLSRDTNIAPLFIVSDYRSGTTLFSELLARTRRINYVKLQHVLNRNRLLHDRVMGLEISERGRINSDFSG